MRGQSSGRGVSSPKGPACLTSSMVHLATVEAEMPATPGRSLQCCSQHTESERSGWADRADMKRDWWMTSVVSAGKQRRKLAGRCPGLPWPLKPACTHATQEDHGPLLLAGRAKRVVPGTHVAPHPSKGSPGIRCPSVCPPFPRSCGPLPPRCWILSKSHDMGPGFPPCNEAGWPRTSLRFPPVLSHADPGGRASPLSRESPAT